ncbi:MAG: hypothetical protein QOF09_3760 [Alphaproteobacteria bacterium]|nr:hypothetical protein [Alphaproteobacteria bacterium]
MRTLRGLGAILVSLATVPPADAAELKIFGSWVTKVTVGELGPQFEEATIRHSINR